MYKYTFTICLLVLFALNLSTSIVHASGTSSSRSGGLRTRNRHYGGYGDGMILQDQKSMQPQLQTPKQYLDNKSGFSTFGIISIIFVAIVFCLAFYYGIVCYPLLCGEPKKYHFMDVSSTITSAISNSLESVEIKPIA